MGSPITEDDFEEYGYKIKDVDKIYAMIFSIVFLSFTIIIIDMFNYY
tara:strand:+ start:4971 stop:5111 length:141 start_codon:yes stop_codon:yes gene_type:complete